MDALELGIGGLRSRPGDHICAFYRSEHRDAVLTPYVRVGMEAGEKSICLLTEADRWAEEAFAGGIRDGACSPIDTAEADDAYLAVRPFSPERVLASWRDRFDRAIGECGFPGVRAAVDMLWALDDDCPTGSLLAYEEGLNELLATNPQIVLCLYDLERYDGDLIVEVLKRHPRVLIGDMVLENPFFLGLPA